jgi:hypothetical protein
LCPDAPLPSDQISGEGALARCPASCTSRGHYVQSKCCSGITTHAGGWDKKLKYWDLNTKACIGEVALEEKVYAMDAREYVLVVATADTAAGAAPGLAAPSQPAKQNADRARKIYVFDLRNPLQPWKQEASPLSYQTRCVAAFPGNAGYLVGSIEGRVGVQNFDGMHPDKQPSYTFKCHRRTLDANGNVVQGSTKVRAHCVHCSTCQSAHACRSRCTQPKHMPG